MLKLLGGLGCGWRFDGLLGALINRRQRRRHRSHNWLLRDLPMLHWHWLLGGCRILLGPQAPLHPQQGESRPYAGQRAKQDERELHGIKPARRSPATPQYPMTMPAKVQMAHPRITNIVCIFM